MTTVLTGVVGSDGRIPVYDPEGLWKTWALSEIWRGLQGLDRFVPKVNDWVVNPETREFFIVDHLDPVSYVPTLRPFALQATVGTFEESDIIIGKGPGAPSDIFRLKVNDEVRPRSAAVDAGCYIYGNITSYAKLFYGTDTTQETGRVISQVYDGNGNFVSSSIPLELAAVDSHVNYNIKVVKRFSVGEALSDGEIVTLAVYADDGHMVYARSLIVENTNTIIDINSGVKYVEDISIKSIWLSNTDPLQLNYPINIPMDSLNMIGVVTYSDGSTVEYPIGYEGKFSMIGLQGRVSSIPGQPHDLVLRYMLDSSEHAISAVGTNNRYLTKPYRIVTINPNYSLQAKLFCYPEWHSSAEGYRLRWFLMNAERNVNFEVTNYVEFAESTGPFNPKLYGYLQRKVVSINLKRVSPAFPSWNHVQTVDIVLNMAPSADKLTSWTVLSEANDSYPRYGDGIYAQIIAGQSKVNLGSEQDSLADWLELVYRRALPITRIDTEVKAPEPTHFYVHNGNYVTKHEVGSWNEDISVGPVPVPGKLLVIRFVRETGTSQLQLGYGALNVKSF